MKKRLLSVLLILVVAFTLVAGLCACNDDKNDLSLKKGGRPNYDSIITKENLDIINAALDENATEAQKKAAVISLLDTANYSRQNAPLSLTLQNSNAGISLGDVIMHGFTLKSGDAWYYQLATQATSSSAFFEELMGEIAGLLKIAYTTGDGNYYYTVVKGSVSECNCKVETFPYASFVVTKEPQLYDEQGFKKELHYLNSMHEINNMKFCEEIIADGATVVHDEQGFYRVQFSVDMQADEQLLKEWFALPKEDMAVGGQNLTAYNSYEATLEIWDNGYAKSFKSYSDREAGMGSGKPVDEFEYLWTEPEIMELLKEDESIEIHNMLNTVDDYIEYYSNPKLVAARLSALKITGIVIACVVVVIVVVIVVMEILIKKGKFPKITAKRQAKKAKRLAKKNAKNGAVSDGDTADGLIDEENFDGDAEKFSDEEINK